MRWASGLRSRFARLPGSSASVTVMYATETKIPASFGVGLPPVKCAPAVERTWDLDDRSFGPSRSRNFTVSAVFIAAARGAGQIDLFPRSHPP